MQLATIHKETIANKITLLHLALFVATLPFDRFYSELALISLLLHTIIHFKQRSFKVYKQWALLPALYLVTLIYTINSQDTEQAFYDWMKQLSLLIIPLILLANPISINKYKRTILTAFVCSCTLVILYLYLHAFYTLYYFQIPYRNILSYAFISHSFSRPLDMHATYLSLYLFLAFIFLMDQWISHEEKKSRTLIALSMAILLSGIIQLACKTTIFCLLIYVNLVFPRFYLKGAKKIKYHYLSLGFTLLFGLIILCKEPFRERMINQLQFDLVSKQKNQGINDSRMARWKVALELIIKNPITGYGTGSEKKILRHAYYEHDLYDSFLNNLNVHNQYLSYLLKGGIPALCLYLLILFKCFRLAILQKDAVYFGFLLSVIITSCSENILDVNKGIFWFAFFCSFFQVCFVQAPIQMEPLKATQSSKPSFIIK